MDDDLTISTHGSTLFIAGEIDMGTAAQLDAVTGMLGEQEGPVIIDVSGVTYMDSTGVHAFIRLLRRLSSWCLILHGANDEVLRVLQVSGLSSVERLHVIPCGVLVDDARVA